MRLPALSVLVALAGFASPALAGSQQSEMSAFFSSSYDYCDAKVLATYWGHDISESKARIGRKLGWGDTDILNDMLGSARTQARTAGTPSCTVQEAGYTYEDAAAMAKVWGVSVSQAKTNMVNKVMRGDEAVLRSELARARGSSAVKDDDSALIDRYANSGYCYCDARVLGTFWGQDTWDAKLAIGRKLGSGNRPALEQKLAAARSRAVSRGETCDYSETNYTSADATALAGVWKVSLTEAKARAGRKLIGGNKGVTDAALKQARH